MNINFNIIYLNDDNSYCQRYFGFPPLGILRSKTIFIDDFDLIFVKD